MSNSYKKCTLRKRYKRLYGIWADMRTRCYNKNIVSYENYGGRGITVCYDWQESFENFFIWAMENGYSDDLTIDRINSNGHYEPNNCRWANKSMQSFNQRVIQHSAPYSGVHYMKRDGVYEVHIGGKYVGRAKTIEEAKEMRRKAELETFGEIKIDKNNIVEEPFKYENICKPSTVEEREKYKRLYGIWTSLVYTNKKKYNYRCREWHTFIKFKDWSYINNYNDDMHIILKDKSKPYTPDNCYYSLNTMRKKSLYK